MNHQIFERKWRSRASVREHVLGSVCFFLLCVFLFVRQGARDWWYSSSPSAVGRRASRSGAFETKFSAACVSGSSWYVVKLLLLLHLPVVDRRRKTTVVDRWARLQCVVFRR